VFATLPSRRRQDTRRIHSLLSSPEWKSVTSALLRRSATVRSAAQASTPRCTWPRPDEAIAIRTALLLRGYISARPRRSVAGRESGAPLRDRALATGRPESPGTGTDGSTPTRHP